MQDVLEPKVLDFFKEKIVKIASGSDHLCVLTDEGKLYGWGYGKT